MKALKSNINIATTIPNLEDITIKEIQEILNIKSKKFLPGRISFTGDSKLLIEKARSIDTVYSLISSFKFKKEIDIYKEIKKLDFSFIKGTFVVRCKKDDPLLSSIETERNIGEIIFKQKHKVNLNNPDTTIIVDIINKNCLIGIKIASDLNKRNYRIRHIAQSINSIIAYSLLRIADIKKTDAILDPFCKDGIIPIEASLFGLKKVYALDEKLNNTKSTQLNAKVAKVKLKVFSHDLSWLDTKFKKNSIDKIVSYIISPSKHISEREIIIKYKEFFHQTSYILKKTGLIVLLCPKDLILEYAKASKFKLISTRKLKTGDINYKIFTLKKGI